MAEKEGRFLGKVDFRQGATGQDGETPTQSLASFTTEADGLSRMKMQISLSGHRTPANVIEGARADRIAAALDAGDGELALELAGVRKRQGIRQKGVNVGGVLARGDRVVYVGKRFNGKHVNVTILRTNVGEVDKYEVANAAGEKWKTSVRNLRLPR